MWVFLRSYNYFLPQHKLLGCLLLEMEKMLHGRLLQLPHQMISRGFARQTYEIHIAKLFRRPNVMSSLLRMRTNAWFNYFCPVFQVTNLLARGAMIKKHRNANPPLTDIMIPNFDTISSAVHPKWSWQMGVPTLKIPIF